VSVTDDSMIPPRAARELARRISRIEERLAELGRSGRRTQLGNSSVDSGMLVAGPRDGRHVRITPAGLRQLEDDGTLLAAFGAGSAGANLVLVVDPATKEALASLSSDGVLSASGFSVQGDVNVNGEDLPGTLAALPKGLVAWYDKNTDSAHTTGEVGIGELQFTAEAGRYYRIDTSAMIFRITAGRGGLNLRWTIDGTTPTVSSPRIANANGENFDSLHMTKLALVRAFEDRTVRLLLTVVATGGNEAWVQAAPEYNIQLAVYDVAGIGTSDTGSDNTGGGGTAAPVTQYTTTWGSTWTRSYNEPDPIREADGRMWQGYFNDGYNGNNVATIGFDDAAIRSALAGATIDKTEVYLYAEHWYDNAGGTVVLGSHNQSAPLSTYPPYARTVDQARWHLNKPEGRWVTVTNVIGEWFRDGYARGLLLDALKFGHNLEYYGRFKGQNAGGYRPHLRIHYTK
jgi:hypothetical protein